MADGGEGTIDVIDGHAMKTTVTGPLGALVEARWKLAGDVALVEMAQASGHPALGDQPRHAVDATTYGTGELIVAALDAGARTIIVGAGGSVTTDGGVGAIDALRPRLPLARVDLVIATDVRTRFRDCARMFGPQKGASEADILILEARLDDLAQRYKFEFGIDVDELPGAGAAGGLAGGLAAIGGRIVPGFTYLAELVDLEPRIAAADLVVTGEGKFDVQSTHGKVVDGVVQLARKREKPVLVLAGVTDLEDVPKSFFTDNVTLLSLVEEYGQERAMRDTTTCIHNAVQAYLQDVVR